jgi:hypothetical protein
MARRIKISTWGTGLRFDKKKGYYVRILVGYDEAGDPRYERDYFTAPEARDIIKEREQLIKDIIAATEGGKKLGRREILSLVKQKFRPASYSDMVRKKKEARKKRKPKPTPEQRQATYEESLIHRRIEVHFPKLTINDVYLYLNEAAIKIFWEFYPEIDYGVSWAIIDAMGLTPEEYEATTSDDDLNMYW